MTKRAVLYARVSGDDRGKEGRNLAGQLEMCREYAQGRGYTVVAELAEDDRGASGAAINLPELTKIRNMAEANKVDVLVVREIDRLSRNLAKQLIVEEELQRAGVGIEYVLGEYPDTPEGRLNKHIKATIAEYEREKINERMTRGRRNSAKAGNVLMHGRPTYGYRLAEVESKELTIYEPGGVQRRVKRKKDDGLKTGRRVLVVHEPEARIVRLIFQWYTVGNGQTDPLPMRGIVERLTEMGVPTWRDVHGIGSKKRKYGEWSDSTVGQMLSNETYIGRWYYGQRRGQERKPSLREHWIPVEVQPIISRQTWEAAQKRRTTNKAQARRNAKGEYLVARRVRCGGCGSNMYGRTAVSKGKSYKYYRCLAYGGHKAGVTCDGPTFRVDHVDAAVWDWVRGLFSDPGVALGGLREEQATREDTNKPLRDRLAVVDDLLDGNRAQLARALDLYLSGDFPREILTERKERLETTIKSLERERADLAAQLKAAALTDERIESLMVLMTKMGEGLEKAEYDFAKRRQLIDDLDVSATLAIEDGQKVAHVRCVLGDDTLSIVSYSTGMSERQTACNGAKLRIDFLSAPR